MGGTNPHGGEGVQEGCMDEIWWGSTQGVLGKDAQAGRVQSLVRTPQGRGDGGDAEMSGNVWR